MNRKQNTRKTINREVFHHKLEEKMHLKKLVIVSNKISRKVVFEKLGLQNSNYWFWRVFHKYNHNFFNISVNPSYHMTIFPIFFPDTV